MIVNGTIHKRNFDGTDKWYFLEELACDIFIGFCIPNDYYIKDNGKVIRDSEIKDWFKDNMVVNGESVWYKPDIENKPWIDDLTYVNINKGYQEF